MSEISNELEEESRIDEYVAEGVRLGWMVRKCACGKLVQKPLNTRSRTCGGDDCGKKREKAKRAEGRRKNPDRVKRERAKNAEWHKKKRATDPDWVKRAKTKNAEWRRKNPDRVKRANAKKVESNRKKRGRLTLKMFREQFGICGICSLPILEMKSTHIDHKVPRAHGGTDDPQNLWLVHGWCNQEKGAKAIANLA